MPIFDQGYQHWSGEVSGRTWRWLAVTRQGIRSGMKSRLLRYVLFAAWGPALALVAMVCMWGLLERGSSLAAMFQQLMRALQPGVVSDPKYYRADIWRLAFGYFLQIELRFAMILILLVGPGLISLDLRFNALPLYLSRPLRRIDYFLGKLGVIVAFIFMVVILPSIVAYLLGLAFSLDITILRDTFGILMASVAYGLIIAFSAGMLILALSALSRNSRYVALLWVGLWFVSGIVSTALQSINSQQRRYYYFSQVSVPPPRHVSSADAAVRRKEADDIRAWRKALQHANDQYRLAELEYSRTDWRPLLSYVENLSRLGQALLKTNQTWKHLSLLQPDEESRDRILARYMGPEFPWYWSAGVLVVLFGISIWILQVSIKSLDRLK